VSLLDAARELRDALADARVPRAPYVYQPLAYAWDAHARYARAYGAGRKRVLLVGMNPGPWGMGQTGVPFGDVVYVRDWMRVTGELAPPARLHPKRPVLGFASKRREPSGSRLYGWAQARFGDAGAFFRDHYVVNYCPLLFYDEAGRNLTPDKLPGLEAVEDACDRHLAAAIRASRAELVVGVGAYAEGKARAVVERAGLADDVRVGRILHPSPASPAANKGWAAQAEAQLRALGAKLPGRYPEGTR
jgi:single-strand selective monofunctional uracil DNA glycosylase